MAPDSRSATPMTMAALADGPAIRTFQRLFSALDAQPLEVVTLAEYDRMLAASVRPPAIADALDDALAQQLSARREKSRARRLSRLGRIAGRQLSLVPVAQSALPSLIENDSEWDDDDDKDDGADVDADVGSTAVSSEQLAPGRRSSSALAASVPLELKPHTQLRLQQQRKIAADNVLRLVLHAQLLPLTTLRGALRDVSTSWRHISTMYVHGVVSWDWFLVSVCERHTVRLTTRLSLDQRVRMGDGRLFQVREPSCCVPCV